MDTARKTDEGHLVGLIADEKTCVGFLLAGIGECDKNGQMNFLTVDESRNIYNQNYNDFNVCIVATRDSAIENFFNDLCERHDIAVLLIDEDVARRISQVIKCWQQPLPIILEIPSSKQLLTMPSEVTLARLEDSYI